MPGRTKASSITFLSMSTQIASRAVVSVVCSALSMSASTAGSFTDRLELPPVARIVRLSTICARNP